MNTLRVKFPSHPSCAVVSCWFLFPSFYLKKASTTSGIHNALKKAPACVVLSVSLFTCVWGCFLLLPTRKSSFLPLFSSTDEKFWDWVSLGLGRSIGCECNKGLMKRGQRTVCTCGTRSTSKTQFLHFLPFGSVSALYVMGGLALPCRHVYVKSTAFPLFLVCIWPKPLKSYELGQALLFTSAPCGNCSYIYNLLSPLTQYKITTY